MKKRIIGFVLAMAAAFSFALGAAQAAPATTAAQVTVTPQVVIGTDSITMNIVIVNNTKKEVTIKHTSGQKYDFQLLDSNQKTLYTWSADKSFMEMLTTTKIKAGQSVTFTETLSGSAYKAIRSKIAYLKAFVTGSASFLNTKGYELPLGVSTQILVTPKAVFVGGSVKMMLEVKNTSRTAVTIEYPSGQRYDFQLLDSKHNVLYTWSADKAFPQMTGSLTIAGGKTQTFSETLSGDAYRAIKDKIMYLRASIPGKAGFINAGGYEVKIKEPQQVLVIPRASFKAGSISMGVTIKNASTGPASIRHATAQKYDFQLLDANWCLLYQWSEGKTFAQKTATTNILSGNSVTFSEVITGTGYQAIRDKIVYLRVTITGTADFLDQTGYVIKLR